MFSQNSMRHLCLISAVLLNGITTTCADEYNADMQNTAVCTIIEPRTVTKVDVYNIFAQPAQTIIGTRDRCTLKFKGDGGRKFKFFVRDLQFMECGTQIKIYDGDWNLNTARFVFGCNSPFGDVFTSMSDKVAVSLEKADAKATGYKFYLRLATEDGPDISAPGPKGGAVGETLSTGVIAGIVVACLLVSVVIVAVVVYCVIVRRNKDEAHMAKAYSMKNLLPSSASQSKTGGSSVHSSVHNSVHSNKPSTAFTYPSFHSTISAKHATCDSIETKSRDSMDSGPPKPIKSVKHEFDSMRKGLERDRIREANKRDEDQAWKEAHVEAQRIDRQARNESSHGLGRSNRNRSALTDTNLKQSLRQARDKGRSLSDRNVNRSSTRSRSTHKSHHRDDAHSERAYSDYTSSYSYRYDDNRDRSRNRTRSTSSQRGQRSASAGSMSRRQRDYYDDYDNYSDNDDRKRSDRHDSVGRRSGTQRSGSHSQSNSRRPR